MPKMRISRRIVKPRIRTFFGGEGKGETAFCSWLEDLRNCEEKRHHHDIHNLLGGDIPSLVSKALKTRKRRNLNKPGNFAKSFLLLDRDRYIQDSVRAVKAEQDAITSELILVWQSPNLEGLLLKLFPDCESHEFPPAKTIHELKKHWPKYQKNFSRKDLRDRFGVEDLIRAAKYDKNLKKLLTELGLA